MHYIRVDTGVLVLGAGLAGLRAAWAALQACPGVPVTVVSALPGPSGSSFANPNRMLGMQVPEGEAAVQAYVREALDLARPGQADPRLVEVLAAEARDRFQDLLGLGLAFKRGPEGGTRRFPGCFSPGAERAVVFTGLPEAHAAFAGRVQTLGGRFLSGLRVRELAPGRGPGKGVAGAWLEDLSGGPAVLVRAAAVVMALGGPASLFALNLSARSGSPGAWGDSYALLRRAGARLINAGYLQFLWSDVATGAYWPLDTLGRPGVKVLAPDGRIAAPRDLLDPQALDGLAVLAESRRHHCPASHGRPDAALDAFAAGLLDSRGMLRVRDPEGVWQAVAPLAQAGNGGARVDEWGRTGVDGLFAVGECASGMHGANRIGGGMVLATQVFGKRAGEAAARLARGADLPWMGRAWPESVFGDRDRAGDGPRLAWLREGMQRFAVLGGRPGLAGFHRRLAQAAGAGGPDFQLAADSTLAVTGALVQSAGRPEASSSMTRAA